MAKATVSSLETGYQPPRQTIDKKSLFNDFAKSRYLLRKLSKQYADRVEMRDTARKRAELAKKLARLDLARRALERAKVCDDAANHLREAMDAVADVMLSFAAHIDSVATIEEQAALLGLSTTAMKREVLAYGEGRVVGTSFALVLTSMPDKHRDMDIEIAATKALLRSIKSNPILDRQCTQMLNEVLGSPVFPVPPPIRPVAVSS